VGILAAQEEYPKPEMKKNTVLAVLNCRREGWFTALRY